LDTPRFQSGSISTVAEYPYAWKGRIPPSTKNSRSSVSSMDKSMIVSIDSPGPKEELIVFPGPDPNSQSHLSPWTEKSKSRVTSMDKTTISGRSLNTPWFMEDPIKSPPVSAGRRHPYAQSRFSNWTESSAGGLTHKGTLASKKSTRSKGSSTASSRMVSQSRSRFSAWSDSTKSIAPSMSRSMAKSLEPLDEDTVTPMRMHPYAHSGFSHETSDDFGSLIPFEPKGSPKSLEKSALNPFHKPWVKERVADLDIGQLSVEKKSISSRSAGDSLCCCHYCLLSTDGRSISDASATHGHEFY